MAPYIAKTRILPETIASHLNTLPQPRQDEARHLIALFETETGFAPQLWSGGMLGFGRYTYSYATGHSGTALATGFAPRKADISLYILPGQTDHSALLNRLGKHRMGKACLYLRHLSDADEPTLRALIRAGLQDLTRLWPVTPE